MFTSPEIKIHNDKYENHKDHKHPTRYIENFQESLEPWLGWPKVDTEQYAKDKKAQDRGPLEKHPEAVTFSI